LRRGNWLTTIVGGLWNESELAIADAIALAARIMSKIDDRWPVAPVNVSMNTQTKEFVYLLAAVCVGTVLYAALRRRKQTEGTSEDKGALLVEYFRAGIDYHTSARFAAFAGFIPLSGNLAHLAVEMYLKGYLCRKLSERERRNLGHRLRKIWKRFKEELEIQVWPHSMPLFLLSTSLNE
jgi:hypothetical protein